MNRTVFFATVRGALFGGALTQEQVDGCTVLLDEDLRRQLDPRWLAYILATTYHETARTMQPIAEYGRGAGRPYGVPDPETGQIFYGRGYVQLTWKANYATFERILSLPLVQEPDLALQPEVACRILFDGMIHGRFTGVGLGRFFTESMTDWVQARRIVNGLDQATRIAGYARQFHEAVTAAAAQEEEGRV